MKLKHTKLAFVIITIMILTIFVPENVISKTTKKSKTQVTKTKKIKKIKKSKTKQHVIESFSKLKQYYPEYYSYISKDTSFIYGFSRRVNVSNNSLFTSTELRYDLLNSINDWIGTPYRSPGRSKRGIDCSNFVSCITEEALGVSIPAGSSTQARLFTPIYNLDSLQFGDLIFFTGRNKKSNRIGHVGFYISNGLFAHSSTGRGVIYTHISEAYYIERYKFGGRFTISDWVVDNSKKSKKEYFTQIPE